MGNKNPNVGLGQAWAMCQMPHNKRHAVAGGRLSVFHEGHS